MSWLERSSDWRETWPPSRLTVGCGFGIKAWFSITGVWGDVRSYSWWPCPQNWQTPLSRAWARWRHPGFQNYLLLLQVSWAAFLMESSVPWRTSMSWPTLFIFRRWPHHELIGNKKTPTFPGRKHSFPEHHGAVGVPAGQAEDWQPHYWRGCLWHRSGEARCNKSTKTVKTSDDKAFVVGPTPKNDVLCSDHKTSGEQLDQAFNDGPTKI